MIAILSTSDQPAFNLAAEEYLLKSTTKDVVFLYINSPSIIVGKHQNALAEINLQYIDYKHIPVYRRLSGGGTVYHDYGNLNFCFISQEDQGKLVDFKRHTLPIVAALKTLELDVEIGKRHDLSIHHKKISGNASHVFKNRAMHHGTLLFSSDLSILNQSLRTDPLKFKDKAVKSVRSEVTNISDHVAINMTMTDFTNHVFTHLLAHFNISSPSHFSKMEEDKIRELTKSKYKTWEWNYGYSPQFEFTRRIRLNNATVLSKVKIEKGFIKELSFSSSNSEVANFLNHLSIELIGMQHHRQVIKNSELPLKFPETGENGDEFLNLLF